MRHALNFQLGLHARGPGRDSYKGVDEWKTPASVSLDRSLNSCRAVPQGARELRPRLSVQQLDNGRRG